MRDFLLHIQPQLIRRRTLRFTTTFGLGLATFISLLLVAISGAILSFHYVPTVEHAHHSVQDIIAVVPGGWWLRNLHRWSGHVTIFCLALHLLRVLFYQAFQGAQARTWLYGVALLLITLATSYSGYLLPWDQDAYWTVTVGTSLVGSFPVVGGWLKQFFLGGEVVGQVALTRFYNLHVLVLPALTILLLVQHFFKIRRAGGLARPIIEEQTASAQNPQSEIQSASPINNSAKDAALAREGLPHEDAELIPANPALLKREMFFFIILTTGLLGLSALINAPLGPAPDIFRPDNPPKAPWFFIGFQELVSYSVVWGGIIIPSILLLVLLAAPLCKIELGNIGRFVAGRANRILLAVTALGCLLITIAAVRWWGNPGDGQSAWLNPATIALICCFVSALITYWLKRRWGLTYQCLLFCLFICLNVFSIVGWFARGSNWILTYHPGPGRIATPSFISDPKKSWRQLAKEQRELTPQFPVEIPLQITAATGNIDRCPTCHRATIEKTDLKNKPVKGHPRIEGHPDLLKFGCTPCHGGQGRRLDMAAHEPGLGAGPDPFMPREYRRARCARCHVPGGLPGLETLEQAITEYLMVGCTGCHDPGRLTPGLGPDLRKLGRRSLDELKKVLLTPREGHEQAVMWSAAWRYAQGDAQAAKALEKLISALLIFSDDPTLYRNSWSFPTVSPAQNCASCHLIDIKTAPIGLAHRCPYLKKNANLACRNCHNTDELKVKNRLGECPQVRSAQPICAVCHRRPEDAAGKRRAYGLATPK